MSFESEFMMACEVTGPRGVFSVFSGRTVASVIKDGIMRHFCSQHLLTSLIHTVSGMAQVWVSSSMIWTVLPLWGRVMIPIKINVFSKHIRMRYRTKTKTEIRISRNMEGWEPLCTEGGNAKWCTRREKDIVGFFLIKNRITIQCSNFISGCRPIILGSRVSKR